VEDGEKEGERDKSIEGLDLWEKGGRGRRLKKRNICERGERRRR